MSRRKTTFLVVGCSAGNAPSFGATSSPIDVHSTVHDIAARYDGRILETTSRDLVAAFPDPASALDGALALQQAIGVGGEPAGTGIGPRIGIDAALSETEAAYDAAIAEARRLRETADAGAIRISPAVYEAAKARVGLEWDQSVGSGPTAEKRAVFNAGPWSVASTLPAGRRTARDRSPAQRKAVRAAALAGAAIGTLTAMGIAGNVWFGSGYRRTLGSRGAPVTVRVSSARIAGSGIRHAFQPAGTARILLTVGVANRSDRELELRREDFRLEIDGREVFTLRSVQNGVRIDDTRTMLALGSYAHREEFRFDRSSLLPGGSAIVGLQFDFPLGALGAHQPEPRMRVPLHPFSHWADGSVVEWLGSRAPALLYRGGAGQLRIDLSGGPLGLTATAGQPSRIDGGVVVYRTLEPADVFNAQRLWRFVEQRYYQESRPLVVDLRGYSPPDMPVRTFLQSRIERLGSQSVAFVADNTPAGNPGVFGPVGAGRAPRAWFGNEADASAYLLGRTVEGPERLRRLATSPDVEIRMAVYRGLADDPSRSTTRLLLQRLRDDISAPARAVAAYALGQAHRRHLDIDPALARAALDDDSQVRAASFQALLDRKALRLALQPALRELKRSHPSALAIRIVGACRHRAAVPRLVELLNHPALPHEAAQALGEIGDSAAIPALRTALRSTSLGKAQMIRAMGRLADRSQRPAVMRDLKSAYDREHTFSERTAVLDAAASLGGPEAVALCLRGLRDESFPVRQSAARTLGRLKAASAVRQLERALADGVVAYDAAKALREIHTPAAYAALSRAAQAGEPIARAMATPVLVDWDRVTPTATSADLE